MELQNTFYVLGIVYMTISLLLILGVVVALFVIRSKVISIEKMIKEKVNMLTSLPEKAAEVIGAFKSAKGK